MVTENTPLRCSETSLVASNTISLGGHVGHVLLRPHLAAKRRVEPAGELPRLVLVAARTDQGALAVAKKVRRRRLVRWRRTLTTTLPK